MTPFEDLDVDEWRRVLEVNVIGQAMATRAVVPVMRRQGGGSIVNVSSGTPFKGVPFMLHYVASKGAVNAMTKALAKELGAADIRVNAVAPGFTLSDGVLANPHQLEKLQDISRQARVIQRDQHPDDIVGAVVFFRVAGLRLCHRADARRRWRRLLPLISAGKTTVSPCRGPLRRRSS